MRIGLPAKDQQYIIGAIRESIKCNWIRKECHRSIDFVKSKECKESKAQIDPFIQAKDTK